MHEEVEWVYIYLQSKEDKDFCPDACVVGLCIHTERLECGEDNEDGGPAVIEREGQVDEQFITP